MLKTKSIQKRKLHSDGIRICIMRRIKPEFEFDMWVPLLSPSTGLLKDYHEEKVNWEQFSKKFTRSVLDKNENVLKMIIQMADGQNVTLLCWEETPEKCHRRLVLERIQNLSPQTEIKLA